MNLVGQRIITQLRQQVYDHLQSLSLSFFDRTATGNLMSRITNDVTMIQGAVSDAVTGMLKDAFSVVALTGVIFYRDWKLAVWAMIVLPFAFFPVVKFGEDAPAGQHEEPAVHGRHHGAPSRDDQRESHRQGIRDGRL